MRQSPVVYLLITHRMPAQVERLVGAIHRSVPGSLICIHHDPRSTPLDVRRLGREGPVHLLENPATPDWGSYGHAEAWLRCFEWLRNSGVRHEWVTVLSGQDYPVEDPAQSARALLDSDFDAALEVFPSTAGPWRPGVAKWRYLTRRIVIPGRPTRFGDWLLRTAERANARNPLFRVLNPPMAPEPSIVLPWPSPFGPDFPLYYGSDWFSVSERAHRTFTDFLDAHREIERHYRHTMIPTESIIHTVLSNTAGIRIGPTNHYVRWSPGLRNPDVFVAADLAEIVGSGAHWTRKLDLDVDEEIFDLLDAHLAARRAAFASPPESVVGVTP